MPAFKSSEIALTGSYLNEIIEIHKKNNIEIPKKIILKSFLDNSFLENKSLGQTHIWRCVFNYIKPAQTAKKFVINIKFISYLLLKMYLF